jgi:arachidonate 15-lipoxygenase (second type) / 8-lipoxygenase (S-type)
VAYELFSIQPLAAVVLFAPGAGFDQILAFTGQSAQDFCTGLYNNGSGRFQANYFKTDLQNRGLINSTYGPELKSFPFYEDASVILNAQEAFMTSFVDSYYSSDSVVSSDKELQNWATESNGPAKAYDFPTSITSKSQLVGILTQIVRLNLTSTKTIQPY